ncbi:MAG: nuclear transport factor 2 family protein [Proteobacteria bacterium]|nr:nuclear transport factor 2 family protein [Pseudomonadota bacterium]HQR03281.1 nuclear transport factor 2 family protein [Rhodocyclaceae bacterium]
MPTKQQIQDTLKRHFTAWNGRDRTAWLANFAEDVHLEDPVGGPLKSGRKSLEATWDNSFKEGHQWTLEPRVMQVCKDQAALYVKTRGTVAGNPVELDSIEIYTVNDAGQIAQLRTYFNPPDGQALDSFFMSAHG